MPDDSRRSDPDAVRSGRSGRSAYRNSSELERILLSILRASSIPLGAYAIAHRSQVIGLPLAPNQVYRILDRLEARAKVRRIESLNAFSAIQSAPGPVMLCRSCGRVGPLVIDPQPDIARLCHAADFRPHRVIVEVIGRCRDCSLSGATDGPRAD